MNCPHFILSDNDGSRESLTTTSKLESLNAELIVAMDEAVADKEILTKKVVDLEESVHKLTNQPGDKEYVLQCDRSETLRTT